MVVNFMIKTKKSNLTPAEIIEITQALNENITANKSRSKEDRIPNDKFIIDNFGISRKKFSKFTKETTIKYNASTHLYHIPEELLCNTKITPNKIKKETAPVIDEEIQNIFQKDITTNSESTVTTDSTLIPVVEEEPSIPASNLQSNNLVTTQKEISEAVIVTLNKQYPELEEMLHWYQKQKDKENIIDVPEINLNREELNGPLVTRSFKTYENTLDKFKEFCKNRKETQKDLLALALCEFMDRYK